jgi:hypothetical protein
METTSDGDVWEDAIAEEDGSKRKRGICVGSSSNQVYIAWMLF